MENSLHMRVLHCARNLRHQCHSATRVAAQHRDRFEPTATPGESEVFQNWTVALGPMCGVSVNFTQKVIASFRASRAIAGGGNTRREKTVQTKTATNSRCRSTLWADARFILEGEGNRSVGRTHARRKGKDSRSCCKPLQSKIKSLSNIFYLSGLASIVCVKTAKKHAVWFEYSYPKI